MVGQNKMLSKNGFMASGGRYYWQGLLFVLAVLFALSNIVCFLRNKRRSYHPVGWSSSSRSEMNKSTSSGKGNNSVIGDEDDDGWITTELSKEDSNAHWLMASSSSSIDIEAEQEDEGQEDSIKNNQVNFLPDGDATDPFAKSMIQLADLDVEGSGADKKLIGGRSERSTMIVIGAGMGTTGTHLFYHATCYMGLSSVHYWNRCISPNNDKTYDEHELQQASNLHNDLIRVVIKMFKCVDTKGRMNLNIGYNSTNSSQNKNNKTNNKKKALCGNAFEWKDTVLRLIDEVVQADVFEGYNDTPYPHLLRPLAQSIRRHRRHNPIILLTERDPESYAKRRSSKDYGETDPLCLHPPPQSSSLQILEDSNSLTGVGSLGGLDLIGCVEHAAASIDTRNGTDSSSSLDLVDVFISYKNLLAQDYAKGIEQISKEFNTYQETVKQYADFSFNMFEQDEKTEVPIMVSTIHQRLPELYNYTKGRRASPLRTKNVSALFL